MVAVARRGEAPIAAAAKDFGISESGLRNLLTKADVEAGIRPGTTAAENEELTPLKRRNRALEVANQVLRRAATYLSRANLRLGRPQNDVPLATDLDAEGALSPCRTFLACAHDTLVPSGPP